MDFDINELLEPPEEVSEKALLRYIRKGKILTDIAFDVHPGADGQAPRVVALQVMRGDGAPQPRVPTPSPLSQELAAEVKAKFPQLFSKTLRPPVDRGEFNHRITLKPDAVLQPAKPVRFSPAQSEAIRVKVQEWLQQGLIRPSSSSMVSNLILVRKKDGTWRICVDLRRVNAATVPDGYRLPLIEELLIRLYDAVLYTMIDLVSAYQQLLLDPKDEWLSAFHTPGGTYQSRAMVFGLQSVLCTI